MRILDDLLIAPFTKKEQREYWEIVEEGYGRKATLVTSQLPMQARDGAMQDPTLADPILE